MKDIFLTQDTELTGEQKRQLIRLLTNRCRLKTFNRITSLVTYDLSTLAKNISWFDRFYICGRRKTVHYMAGQSMPCELRSIRNDILKRYP